MEMQNNRIKELRQQKGMTQRAFAEYLGIPLRKIEDCEANKRTPPEYLVNLIQFRIEHDTEN